MVKSWALDVELVSQQIGLSDYCTYNAALGLVQRVLEMAFTGTDGRLAADRGVTCEGPVSCGGGNNQACRMQR
jgi:hypothetical protein